MRLKKKNGNFNIMATAVFFAVILIILMLYGIQKNKVFLLGETARDCLTSSCLASLTIKSLDLKELGTTDNLIVKDPEKVFNKYKQHIMFNFNLDNNLKPKGSSYIKSKLNMESLILYNVKKNEKKIEIYKFDESGNYIISSGIKGNVKTPKGTIVENTTVHGAVGFKINAFKTDQYVSLSEDVDIVN